MCILLLLLAQIGIVLGMLFVAIEGIPALMGGMAVFTAGMMLVVINTRGNAQIKLAWCALIAVIPVLGTAIYLFATWDIGHRAMNRMVQRTLRDTRRYQKEDAILCETLQREDPAFFGVVRYLQEKGFTAYDDTQVTYYPVGERMYQAMLEELKKAEQFIFLEYFLIDNGKMWQGILDILKEKAAQGVLVRVLYDGSCAVSCLPDSYPRELEKLGIACKVFSPFRPLVSTHYNNRDHRKIAVVDGKTAFTGGINLQDRYINQGSPFGHWKDTAVRLHGKAVRGLTLMFLQMWNCNQQLEELMPFLVEVPASAGGCVIPYGDTPTDDAHIAKAVYMHILNQAKDYVYIMTPYLILDDEMISALCFAVNRGVDVRLLVPHIPDKKLIFVLTRSFYRELMEKGVKIYEYTPGFVHGKMFLSDDAHGIVGTINLDYRSLYLHYECAAYLYRVDALEDIRQDFEDAFAKSTPITMQELGKQKGIFRLVSAVLRVFAPLL